MLSEITAFSNVTTPLSLEVELQASVCGEGGNTTPRHRLLHHLESKIKLEATNCRRCKYNARCWAVKLYSGASALAGKPHCCRNWKHIDARKSGYDVVYARLSTRAHSSCKPMPNVTIDLAQLDWPFSYVSHPYKYY